MFSSQHNYLGWMEKVQFKPRFGSDTCGVVFNTWRPSGQVTKTSGPPPLCDLQGFEAPWFWGDLQGFEVLGERQKDWEIQLKWVHNIVLTVREQSTWANYYKTFEHKS